MFGDEQAWLCAIPDGGEPMSASLAGDPLVSVRGVRKAFKSGTIAVESELGVGTTFTIDLATASPAESVAIEG